jgi:hypothetical protein
VTILAVNWQTLFADFAFLGGYLLGWAICIPIFTWMLRRHFRRFS